MADLVHKMNAFVYRFMYKQCPMSSTLAPALIKSTIPNILPRASSTLAVAESLSL